MNYQWSVVAKSRGLISGYSVKCYVVQGQSMWLVLDVGKLAQGLIQDKKKAFIPV